MKFGWRFHGGNSDDLRSGAGGSGLRWRPASRTKHTIVCANAVPTRDCKGTVLGIVLRYSRDRAEHPETQAKGSSALSLLSASDDHSLSTTRNHSRHSTTWSRVHTSLSLEGTALRTRRKNSTATPHQQLSTRCLLGTSIHNLRTCSTLEQGLKGMEERGMLAPRCSNLLFQDQAVVLSRPADAR